MGSKALGLNDNGLPVSGKGRFLVEAPRDVPSSLYSGLPDSRAQVIGDTLRDKHAGQIPYLFNKLSPEQIKLLESRCIPIQLARGKTVFTQDELQSHTYIIRNGLIRTYYTSLSGREITLCYWSEGDMIGGPYFFNMHRKNVWSARASKPSTVWAIRGDDLKALAMQMPALQEYVLESLSFKLYCVSLMLQTMGTESARSQLAAILIRLTDLYGVQSRQGILIRYEFSQRDLANMIGVSRQWVNVTLQQMRKEGLVTLQSKYLVVQDKEGLHRLSKNIE